MVFQEHKCGSPRVAELNAQRNNIKNWIKKSGKDLEKIKNRLYNKGSSDYIMKMSIIYQENYKKEMKKYAHLDNYEYLEQKINRFKNPINFYKFISQFEIYGDLTIQSDQYYTQQEFNSMLEEMDIDYQTKNYKKSLKYHNAINENGKKVRIYENRKK